MTNNNMDITIPFSLNEGEQVQLIEGYPNYYITSHGRIYSIKNHRFIGAVDSKSGYVYVSLRDGQTSYPKTVHRLVMQAFGPPPPNNNYDDYEVDHKDKNPSNNNINNLQWLTHQENLMNRRPYTQNRKQRLTKDLMHQFNRWYCQHQQELAHLSNQAVANKCKQDLDIDINIQTILINRGRWTINPDGELIRVNNVRF